VDWDLGSGKWEHGDWPIGTGSAEKKTVYLTWRTAAVLLLAAMRRGGGAGRRWRAAGRWPPSPASGLGFRWELASGERPCCLRAWPGLCSLSSFM
jgi:hypothetical protein